MTGMTTTMEDQSFGWAQAFITEFGSTMNGITTIGTAIITMDTIMAITTTEATMAEDIMEVGEDTVVGEGMEEAEEDTINSLL
jgi:hypothetical protein